MIEIEKLHKEAMMLAAKAQEARCSDDLGAALAIYHRSYQVREPVEVRISPEDFIVLSYPRPDRSIRLEQLRAGQAVLRRYRNRRIGEFLKELDLTEGRSTGTPKILRAMRQNGSPPPEFDFDEDHSYFQVRLPVHPEARMIEKVDIVQQGTEQVAEQVTEQVERLITAIGSREVRTREIMEMMGLQHRPTFLYDFLQPAINMGFVAMTQPDKFRSSKQRYRVTEKGRMWPAGQQKA